MKKVTISGFCLLLLLFVVGMQAQTKVDYNQMNRDLRIMEKILGSLLSEENSYFRVDNVKVAYLDGYGVVFTMPIVQKSIKQSILSTDVQKSIKQSILSTEKKSLFPEKSEQELQTEMKKSFTQIQDAVKEFFSSYADAIKQLQSNDVITVFAFISQSGLTSTLSFSTTTYWYDKDFASEKSPGQVAVEFKPYSFLMSVKKDDITQYRKSAITLTDFYNKISFAPIGKDAPSVPGYQISKEMETDIKVLNGIIETVLEDTLHTTLSSSAVQGTYLKNYGVLFTANVGYISSGIIVNYETLSPTPTLPLPSSVYSIFGDTVKTIIAAKDTIFKQKFEYYSKALEYYSKVAELERAYEKSLYRGMYYGKKNLISLPNVFIELLGDYGRTLRGLNPNDQITILFSSYQASDETNFIVMVKYKDILEYSDKKITLETLKSRASSRYFN